MKCCQALVCGMVTVLALTSFTRADDTREAAVNRIVANTDIAYVSDYISFTGQDEHGYVTFALDTNRGRDGADYQAEHFVVLHDQKTGWIRMQGGGSYENKGTVLTRLPDSQNFRFTGDPATGLTVDSTTNGLSLIIDPIPERTSRSDDGFVFSMGSAPAVLRWHGRVISGRVIYELLAMAGFNRLSGITLGSGFGSFQGLYLYVEGSDDLYIHQRLGGDADEISGFGAIGDETIHLRHLEFEVTELAFAPGFFRWPRAWTIRGDTDHGPISLSIRLHDRKLISTWILGGFAMGIVQGTLDYGGRTFPVYGLGELIM